MRQPRIAKKKPPRRKLAPPSVLAFRPHERALMSGSVDRATASQSVTDFPIVKIRALFPALRRDPNFIFFDNAAGAQIPQAVFDAVNHHLLDCNVQRGGRYGKSQEVDRTIAQARESVAIFLNARDS